MLIQVSSLPKDGISQPTRSKASGPAPPEKSVEGSSESSDEDLPSGQVGCGCSKDSPGWASLLLSGKRVHLPSGTVSALTGSMSQFLPHSWCGRAQASRPGSTTLATMLLGLGCFVYITWSWSWYPFPCLSTVWRARCPGCLVGRPGI